MTAYTKTTNFAAKDSLLVGNANKIIKGTEHDTEYNNIATAINSKTDASSPTFTGTANFANIASGALSGTTINNSVIGGSTPAAATFSTFTLASGATATAILDEDNLASNSATALITQQSAKAYVDAQVVAANSLPGALALGNTTGANDIVVTAGQEITTDTISETTAAAGVTIDGVLIKDGAVTGLVVGTDVQAYDADTAKLDVAQTFTATQSWAKGADIASATGLTLGTDGNYFDITGTTTIATIGTVAVGTVVKLHFDAILTLTHSADLALTSGADITTAAGDEAEFVEYASGDWRCTAYSKADGTAVVSAAGGAWTYLSTTTASAAAQVDVESGFSATYDSYVIVGRGITTGSADSLRERWKLGGVYQTGGGYKSLSSAGSTSTLGTSGLVSGSGTSFAFKEFLTDVNAAREQFSTGSSVAESSSVVVQNYGTHNFITGALSGVRYFCNGGQNITGFFDLYGIKNS